MPDSDTTRPDGSTPSSAGSYTTADVHSQTSWQAEVSKLKVAQLDELLTKKGVTSKGLKPEKAEMVAWYYTREEINTWRRQQAAARPPPAGVESGQKRMEDFFGK